MSSNVRHTRRWWDEPARPSRPAKPSVDRDAPLIQPGRPLSPGSMLELQRLAGNRAVSLVIARQSAGADTEASEKPAGPVWSRLDSKQGIAGRSGTGRHRCQPAAH